jgi:very-short-patch-repair endonuclease
MTGAEAKLWSLIRDKNLGVRFRRQVAFGPCVLDFLAIEPKLVVELDGSQHYTPRFRDMDRTRDTYLESNGLTVLRYSSGEFMRKPNDIVQDIAEHVEKKLSEKLAPSPPRRGPG